MIDPDPQVFVDWPTESAAMREYFNSREMTLAQCLALLAAGFAGGIQELARHDPNKAVAIMQSLGEHLRELEAVYPKGMH